MKKQKYYNFSFKPSLAIQGIVVLALVLFSLVTIGNLLIPKPQISESQIIKDFTLKQTSTIVTNSKPIKWTILVRRSDISDSQHLVRLPKTARNKAPNAPKKGSTSKSNATAIPGRATCDMTSPTRDMRFNIIKDPKYPAPKPTRTPTIN